MADDFFPIHQVVNGEGKLVDSSYKEELTVDLAKELYRKMLRARVFDRKSVNMQRQGRIGTYVPFEGQEAAQIGSALALEDGDWMFPTYRDHGATMTYGQSLKNILLYWNGRYEGGLPPKGKNIFPPAVPIASQILHATGAAWAEKKKGSNRVSIVYFGDGATSEGDFHEGLNFSSVFNAPVVFFNQNNGFAISVPMKRQMKAKTIAQKALGYDIEGVRLDGNDVFAVYFETKKAIERARKGDGPTLLEAVTWRYGAHTTSDDPSKYRENNEEENKRRRETEDPLGRVERYLIAEGHVDEAWIESVEGEVSKEVNAAVEEMEAAPKADVEDMFDHVFAEPTWTIEEQKRAHLELKGGDGK
ncbi:MAG TPA: pyruvate dehydrogenase (acetyl-transferring) E1 component subunit alpha [Bacillales bacterium]|nr:pyruvate dehydrogenase (acetyl-transferring) E1 component subunit alpha [Bacillales bacterium]